MDKFEKAFEEVLGYEGGYSNEEHDSGGVTKFGITENLARRNGYEGDMKDLTLEKAKEIYKKNYWQYENLPQEVAIECFDQAVNMGVQQANIHLQKSCDVLLEREIAIDGIIGPQTEQAVSHCRKDSLLKLLNIYQGMRYVKIVKKDETQRKFINGWLKRVEV